MKKKKSKKVEKILTDQEAYKLMFHNKVFRAKNFKKI